MSSVYDVIIIGSGPAGLAAAFAASKRCKRVLLLEKMAEPGMKLLASGGSRCNVTNILPLEEFATRFGKSWRFLLPALSGFHGKTLLNFFSRHGVPLHLTDGFHYFPVSGKARDVRDLFLREIIAGGGKIICGKKVVSLIPGEYWQVICDDEIYHADKVICASGGRGYPALGGSMAGYCPVEKLGHKITPLYPAMTGVVCEDLRVRECAGIALPDCRTSIALKGCKNLCARGELLFTHHGFSAFAILDLASEVARLLEKHPSVPLEIDFFPDKSESDILQLFAEWRKHGGNRHISTLLNEHLPKKIAHLLLDGDDPEISHWQSASSAELLKKLKSVRFSLTAVEPWEKAMVTAGGVSLKDVDPHTLMSKLHTGLYFAGEMLDVTGPCGGFNITWALASGMLAGNGV